jgi:hypothetical protein
MKSKKNAHACSACGETNDVNRCIISVRARRKYSLPRVVYGCRLCRDTFAHDDFCATVEMRGIAPPKPTSRPPRAT